VTGRRAIRALAALGLLIVGSMWAPPAQAEDVTGTVQRVGWWTKRPGAQPTVPPAAFEVAFGTDLSPNSVAAIDVAVPVQPVQALQISLTELAGTANQIGHIRVCLAAPGWATANAGAYDDAPSIDCSNAADLTRSLDGNWLGDISALVPNGGTVSLGVILVDDLGAPISIGASVQIAQIAITGQSGEAIAPTDTTPTTTDPGGFDDSVVEPSSGFVPPPTGTFDVPPLDTPAGEEAPAATTTTVAEPPPPLLPAAFDSEATPWWRLILLAPLALAMGFAAVYSRRMLEARGISFGG
jgi:hypothetical protein